MTRHGVEYINSTKKRQLDRLVAATCRPANLAARIALARASGDGHVNWFTQERTGQHGEPFRLWKMETLAADRSPVSSLAAAYRRNGIDELGQIRNVREGSMSTVGWRPVGVEDHEQFMDCLEPDTRRTWERLVLPTKPGIISSSAILIHSGETISINHRAELDIEDVYTASFQQDVALIANLGRLLTSHGMHSGHVQLTSELHPGV